MSAPAAIPVRCRLCTGGLDDGADVKNRLCSNCKAISEAVERLTQGCTWITGDDPRVGVMTCGAPNRPGFSIAGERLDIPKQVRKGS